MRHGFADDIEHIGLIKRTTDGRIVQIGMTQEQQRLLQIFLGSMSQDTPLAILPNDYELVLKSEVSQ